VPLGEEMGGGASFVKYIVLFSNISHVAFKYNKTKTKTNCVLIKLGSGGELSDIGINDVLNLIIVKDLFTRFDLRSEGVMSPMQFHQALRYFGLFYSHMQVCAVLENFWQERGTVLEHHMDIDLETFLRLLIGYKRYEPVRDLNIGVWYQRPSLIADVIARVCYPLIYVLRCFIFALILDSY
jgi:hypothetical protein